MVRHLHLFVDFDGTLVPIPPAPEAAVLSPRARATLLVLVARPHTTLAIVSGRSVETLARKVAIDGAIYVGNHGMETLANGVRAEDPIATAARPAIARLGGAILALASAHPGALLENKAISLSLHTRGIADLAERAAVEAEARALAGAEPTLVCSGGKAIVEIRPRGAPHKGDAILALLAAAHGAAWDVACEAIFLGDDLTDEDGFRALAGRGRGIRVDDGTPRPSAAGETVAGVDGALDLLSSLAGMR